jgi:hypothetical protein
VTIQYSKLLSGPWLPIAASLAVWWQIVLGDYVYDDAVVVTGNRAVRDFDVLGLVATPFFREHLGYWRPLGNLALAAAHQAGLVGIHVASLLVHVLCVGVAWSILGRVASIPKLSRAVVVTAFALHPVHAECLAWASSLPAMMAWLWSLLAVRVALSARSWRWSAAAFLLFAALLSHELAIVVAWVLAMLPFVRREEKNTRWLGALMWIVGAVCIWWVVRKCVLGEAHPSLKHGVAVGHWLDGAAEILVREFMVLSCLEPMTPFRVGPVSFVDGRHGGVRWAFLAVFALLFVVSARIWLRKPMLRLPLLLAVGPAMVPALAWPVLGEFPIQDRYLTLPAFGATTIVFALLLRPLWLQLLMAFGMAFMALGQAYKWRSQDTLVAHGLQLAPDRATIQIMAGDLGLIRVAAGDSSSLSIARSHYERSLVSEFPFDAALRQERRAASFVGLGWCYFFASSTAFPRDGEQVLELFRLALQESSSSASALVGIGTTLSYCNRVVEAEDALKRALAINPNLAEAWNNLGLLQLDLGRTSEARRSLQEALRCDPSLVVAAQVLQRLERR